jgi:anti-sigma28 factor (negative regulator of flagellin synthesis)
VRTASPSNPPAERLRTARILAIVAARDTYPRDDDLITQRVMTLRDQIARGAYRVDPDALAATIQASIMAGGI